VDRWQGASARAELAGEKHSPNGFAWDYGGSGPAQFALVLLLELTTEPMVLLWSQKVKWHIITPCPRPTSPWTRR
jgi:hypothetical protein